MAATRFDARRYASDFEQAWNAKDAETFLAKHYANDVEFTDPTGELQRGVELLRKTLDEWFNAFSEMSIQVTQTLRSGNELALVQRFRGLHTGDLEIVPGERIPATHKSAELEVAEFIRLNEQGKIVRDLIFLDTGRLLMQLGILPSASQAAAARRAVQR